MLFIKQLQAIGGGRLHLESEQAECSKLSNVVICTWRQNFTLLLLLNVVAYNGNIFEYSLPLFYYRPFSLNHVLKFWNYSKLPELGFGEAQLDL